MNFTDCFDLHHWPCPCKFVWRHIYMYLCERQGTMENEITCISGHEFYTGSICSRPLTYNLGLKSLQILYQTALCMESTCKIQNELGRWMERNYNSDKKFTQVCNYDQNHNRCDKHKKTWTFLKNNAHSKTLCEWSTDLIGPKQEKICSIQRSTKDLLWSQLNFHF